MFLSHCRLWIVEKGLIGAKTRLQVLTTRAKENGATFVSKTSALKTSQTTLLLSDLAYSSLMDHLSWTEWPQSVIFLRPSWLSASLLAKTAVPFDAHLGIRPVARETIESSSSATHVPRTLSPESDSLLTRAWGKDVRGGRSLFASLDSDEAHGESSSAQAKRRRSMSPDDPMVALVKHADKDDDEDSFENEVKRFRAANGVAVPEDFRTLLIRDLLASERVMRHEKRSLEANAVLAGIETLRRRAEPVRSLEDLRGEAGFVPGEPLWLTCSEVMAMLNSRAPQERKKVHKIDCTAVIQLVERSMPSGVHVMVCGELRRGQLECEELELLLSPDKGEITGMVRAAVERLRVSGVVVTEDGAPTQQSRAWRGVCATATEEYPVHIGACTAEERGGALVFFTGSRVFVECAKQRARERGLVLTPRGVWKHGKLLPSASEAAIWAALGVTQYPPVTRTWAVPEEWIELERAEETLAEEPEHAHNKAFFTLDEAAPPLTP